MYQRVKYNICRHAEGGLRAYLVRVATGTERAGQLKETMETHENTSHTYIQRRSHPPTEY